MKGVLELLSCERIVPKRFLGFAQVGKIVSVIALAGAVLFFIFRFWFD